MSKPSIGRIVHYVLPRGPHSGQHRPAVILRRASEHPASTVVDLTVFATPSDEYPVSFVATDVREDSPENLGTWHCPETVS